MKDRPPTRRPAPRPRTIPPAFSLALRAQSRRWRDVGDLAALRQTATQATEAAIAIAPVKPRAGAELSLLLTDDKRIRVVNRDWRGLRQGDQRPLLPRRAARADRRQPRARRHRAGL